MLQAVVYLCKFPTHTLLPAQPQAVSNHVVCEGPVAGHSRNTYPMLTDGPGICGDTVRQLLIHCFFGAYGTFQGVHFVKVSNDKRT